MFFGNFSSEHVLQGPKILFIPELVCLISICLISTKAPVRALARLHQGSLVDLPPEGSHYPYGKGTPIHWLALRLRGVRVTSLGSPHERSGQRWVSFYTVEPAAPFPSAL